ncbi:Theileria-specific sub-telomeric protein, SVSP family [Theileria annulata]|uniref:Conserved Theileria-specific sub-telomeric protein, SVSP family n=1 Tax=Theileria annulata TaxID=5874 RepID=Q4UFW6_THEAN|nr:Theileria-specific sub-telomeric protein, SVSP family [Theileria annulata]CAI74023.1 conserved Theileria-specific sub-telomeric protein, SVSP family [Theileria annulata]|eukprot:XP_954703.1 conserved Theileria-specific sub-telomeric protein, SVSP family [Theileria annulata]
MQRCVIYTYGLIIVLISYTHCSDKPDAKLDDKLDDNADENASSNIYDIIDFIQDQPTPQDGKYYLIEPHPGKDGKFRLVPITHLEYIPATPEPTEPLTESESPGPYQQYGPGYQQIQSTPQYQQYIPQYQPQYSGYHTQPYYPEPQQYQQPEPIPHIQPTQSYVPEPQPKDTQLEPLLESESESESPEEDNFEVTETTVETNESGVQGIFEKDYEPVVSQPESLLTEDESTETIKPNEPKHPHHSYKHNRPTPRHGKITETIVKPEQELEPMKHMKPIYHKPGYYKQADTIRKKSESTKICKQITFIKKDEMGNFVEMDNLDFDIDYEVKTTIKYSFKTNLEIIYCDGEIVYTHDIGTEYPVSLKYSKFMGRFIMQLRKDFLFIRYLDDRWLVKTRKIPDYIKIFTQDDQGNYIELTPEHCNIDITSTGSFKYNVDSLKCTRIEYYNELVWDKRIKRGYPMTICYSLKISFMIYFKGYVSLYERINGMFYLKHIRSNRTKGS